MCDVTLHPSLNRLRIVNEKVMLRNERRQSGGFLVPCQNFFRKIRSHFDSLSTGSGQTSQCGGHAERRDVLSDVEGLKRIHGYLEQLWIFMTGFPCRRCPYSCIHGETTFSWDSSCCMNSSIFFCTLAIWFSKNGSSLSPEQGKK